jgi:hypothetical protein
MNIQLDIARFLHFFQKTIACLALPWQSFLNPPNIPLLKSIQLLPTQGHPRLGHMPNFSPEPTMNFGAKNMDLIMGDIVQLG